MKIFTTYIPFLVSFIAGIGLYDCLNLPIHLAVVFSPLIFIFINRKSALIVFLIILAFEAGVGDSYLREQQFSNAEDKIARYLNQNITVDGKVVSYPIPSSSHFSYVIETSQIQLNHQWEKAKFRVQIHSKTFQAPEKGDIVEIQTKLRVPAFFQDVQKIKQIHAYGTVIGDTKSAILNEAHLPAEKIRQIIFERSKSHMSPQGYGYYRAMVFGDQALLGQLTIERMKVTGLLHLFVVSGSHIAFAWMLGFVIFRYALSMFGIFHRRKTFFLWIELSAIIFVLMFLHLINPPISSFRAVGSMVLFLSLNWFKRYQHPLWNLGIVFFATLIFNPLYLFDISTQLTFAAVAGILCMSMLIKKYIKREQYSKVVIHVIKAAGATVGAGIFTFPVLYLQFGTFYPLSLLYNLILVPTLGALTSVLSVASLVWALIPSPFLHQIGFGFLDILFEYFEKMIFWNPHLPDMTLVNPLFSGLSGLYLIWGAGGVGMAFIITQHFLKKRLFEK